MSKSSEAMSSRTAFGILWFVLQNLTSRATAFLSQIVLAWLLTPADFGLIGLTYAVTSIASTVVNFGVDDVLTQRQHALRFWTGSALWVSGGLGLAGGLGVAALSPLFAGLYHAPKMMGLLWVLALSMPIGALSTVPTVLLRAELRFKFLAGWSAAELITQQLLTIILAWRGFGAYAFVLPVPAVTLARVVVFWAVAKRPERLAPNRRQSLHLFNNGAAVFGSKLIASAIGQGDYAILGIFASSSVVGAYFFAFRLAAQPLFLLAGNFSTVIYPVLTRFRGDVVRQREAAMRASRLLTHLVMPLGFIQAAVARPLIHAAFGARWLAAIPLVQILSIGLAIDAIPWIAGGLLSARGGFKRGLVYAVLSLPLFFGLVVVGAIHGAAVGVALAVAAYYLIYAPSYSYAIFRREGVPVREIAELFLRPPALAAAAAAAGLLAAAPAERLWQNGLWLAAVIGLVSTGVYVVLVRVFSAAVYEDVASRLRHILADKLPPGLASRFV